MDTEATDTNSGGCGCQNPRHRDEPASGITDQRHLFVGGYVWQLPVFRNSHGILGAIAGGWNFEGLVTIASGNPFDIQESIDSQNNDGLWERPVLTGQPLQVANPNPAGWFNTAAFAPSVYVYGNSPRNPIVGPGTNVYNLTLAKTFKTPWREGDTLELRLETFNTFNTPQFSNPDAKLGDAVFGHITSTKIDNRQLQLGLKYRF
jgi:hypothetical protein